MFWLWWWLSCAFAFALGWVAAALVAGHHRKDTP